MNLPSVSIILPIYNVEGYISKSLISICQQTYKGDIECLLIDDCGKDKSCEIAQQIISNYNGQIKFRWIKHPYNKGISTARNTGIKSAKNDYIYMLDSDDYITPNCIERLCNYIIQYGEVDIVQSNYAIIYNGKIKPSLQSMSNSPLLKTYIHKRQDVKRLLLNMEMIPMMVWNKLIRRKLITENSIYFPEGMVWEDGYWTFFLAKYAQNMCIHNEVTYYYIQRANSIMNSNMTEIKKQSSRFLITSFIDNIDPICRKAQKDRIFYILKREYVYAVDEIERDYYKREFLRFSKQCSPLGYILIHFITRIPLRFLRKRILYTKIIPMLQKII